MFKVASLLGVALAAAEIPNIEAGWFTGNHRGAEDILSDLIPKTAQWNAHADKIYSLLGFWSHPVAEPSISDDLSHAARSAYHKGGEHTRSTWNWFGRHTETPQEAVQRKTHDLKEMVHGSNISPAIQHKIGMALDDLTTFLGMSSESRWSKPSHMFHHKSSEESARETIEHEMHKQFNRLHSLKQKVDNATDSKAKKQAKSELAEFERSLKDTAKHAFGAAKHGTESAVKGMFRRRLQARTNGRMVPSGGHAPRMEEPEESTSTEEEAATTEEMLNPSEVLDKILPATDIALPAVLITTTEEAEEDTLAVLIDLENSNDETEASDKSETEDGETEKSDTEKSETEKSETEKSGTEQDETEKSDTEKSDTEQDETELSETEQNETEVAKIKSLRDVDDGEDDDEGEADDEKDEKAEETSEEEEESTTTEEGCEQPQSSSTTEDQKSDNPVMAEAEPLRVDQQLNTQGNTMGIAGSDLNSQQFQDLEQEIVDLISTEPDLTSTELTSTDLTATGDEEEEASASTTGLIESVLGPLNLKTEEYV